MTRIFSASKRWKKGRFRTMAAPSPVTLMKSKVFTDKSYLFCKSFSIFLNPSTVMVCFFLPPVICITFTSISAAFSMVCMIPNAISGVSPLQTSLWCGHITASYRSISLPVAIPISAQHGTINMFYVSPDNIFSPYIFSNSRHSF